MEIVSEPKGPRGRFEPWIARLAVALLLGGLLMLAYFVLELFLVPLAWAMILAYVTWPLNCRLRARLKRRSLAALLMTVLLGVAIVLPLLLITASLRQEVRTAFEWLGATLEGGADMLPHWLRSLPWIGPWVTELSNRIAGDPQLLSEWLAQRAGSLAGEAADVAGAIGRNVMKFGFALLAVFFIYRDGEQLLGEFRFGLRSLLGEQAATYWIAAADMSRAVVYGLVLTALAQGTLAGLGYWAAGVNAPVLVGALTALAALIPFGAPVVWGTVALYLMWFGELWAGLALVAWGALAVSSVDNLVRPLVISASAHLPFLVVLFGVLGGLGAFGLVGLFVGPIILSVLLAVWRHWLDNNRPRIDTGPQAPVDRT